ncbi:MAG TPA: phosphatase PAP2 family protein [Phototrophicaceae bacterium]|nr:phosphatase PAP2 family protein [Phototrophicaceae bacterium]
MTWLERLRLRVSLGLVLALVISAASLWLFAAIADEVREDEFLTRFDLALANELHARAIPVSTQAFLLISWIGSPGGGLLALGVGLLFILRQRWTDLFLLAVDYGGGEMLNLLLKTMFSRPRPAFVNPLTTASYYSFPSGHAMGSLVTYGMLTYLLVRAVPNRRMKILIIFAAGLLVLLVGLSRLYLGVHYFSDVVAGFAAGAIWLTACITAAERLRKRR